MSETNSSSNLENVLLIATEDGMTSRTVDNDVSDTILEPEGSGHLVYNVLSGYEDTTLHPQRTGNPVDHSLSEDNTLEPRGTDEEEYTTFLPNWTGTQVVWDTTMWNPSAGSEIHTSLSYLRSKQANNVCRYAKKV